MCLTLFWLPRDASILLSVRVLTGVGLTLQPRGASSCEQ